MPYQVDDALVHAMSGTSSRESCKTRFAIMEIDSKQQLMQSFGGGLSYGEITSRNTTRFPAIP